MLKCGRYKQPFLTLVLKMDGEAQVYGADMRADTCRKDGEHYSRRCVFLSVIAAHLKRLVMLVEKIKDVTLFEIFLYLRLRLV